MFRTIIQGTYLANITFSVICANCLFQPASGDGACSQSQPLCLDSQGVAEQKWSEWPAPTWPCMQPGMNEGPGEPQDSSGLKGPTGSVVNKKKHNKNPLEYNRDKPVGNAHTSSLYTLETTMGFTVHCLTLLHGHTPFLLVHQPFLFC